MSAPFSLVLEPTKQKIGGARVWRAFAILPTMTIIGPEDMLIEKIGLRDGGVLEAALVKFLIKTEEVIVDTRKV